jgi:hypothetical protein
MVFSSSFEQMHMRDFSGVNTKYPYFNWKAMLFCWTLRAAYEAQLKKMGKPAFSLVSSAQPQCTGNHTDQMKLSFLFTSY